MNFYIVFFLPCVLGLLVYYILTKEKKYFNLGLIYFVNVLLTNICNMGVLFIKDKTYYDLVNRIGGDFRFSFKYMLLGILFSIIVGVTSAIIKKYCVFSVEVKNGRKK